MLRTAGFPLIICPSVALAHMLVTGSAPPAVTMAAVVLVAGLSGALADRSGHSGAGRLGAQLAGAQVLGHLIIYLALGEPSNGCLPALGRGAELGLRMAILHQQPSCAPGHYAAGILASTAAAVLLVAVAVVLWQILAAAFGSALLRMAEQAWTTVTVVLGAVALAVQEFTAIMITGMAVWHPAEEPRAALQSIIARTLLLRGPPGLST